MTDADKLAQVLAEHAPVIRVDRIGSPSGCQCMDRVFYKTETWHDHLAAVVLAHLTAEGWAQGREEWGVAGRCDEKPFMWGVSREDAELESAADGYRLMRRTAAYTEWEEA